MCEHFGYEVTRLKRTRIMNVKLDALKLGQWRNLSAEEMAEINQAVGGLSGNAGAAGKSRPRRQNGPKTGGRRR